MNRTGFLRALTLTTLGGLTYSCKEYDSLDLGDMSNLNLNLGNPKEELIAFYQKFKQLSVNTKSRGSINEETDIERIILDKLEKTDSGAFKHFSKAFVDVEIISLKNIADIEQKKRAVKTLLGKSSKKLADYMDGLQVVISDSLEQNVRQNNDISQESFNDIIFQIKTDIDKKTHDKGLTYHEKLAMESISSVYDVFGEKLSKFYADASLLIIEDKKIRKVVEVEDLLIFGMMFGTAL